MTLTPKEIKQAVQFADGFGIEPEHVSETVTGDIVTIPESIRTPRPLYTLDVFPNHHEYDLFLDRVIQGINSSGRFLEIQYRGEGIVFDNPEKSYDIRSSYFEHDGTTAGIRTAREEVIRYVLGMMEG